MSAHGTNTRYNQGCSCRRCRHAHADATRHLNLARQAAARTLAREYPLRFRELYEAELVARGISLKPVGRPQDPNKGCGTYAGAGRHRRANESLCDACREAKRAYDRARRIPEGDS